MKKKTFRGAKLNTKKRKKNYGMAGMERKTFR